MFRIRILVSEFTLGVGTHPRESIPSAKAEQQKDEMKVGFKSFNLYSHLYLIVSQIIMLFDNLILRSFERLLATSTTRRAAALNTSEYLGSPGHSLWPTLARNA